MFHVKQPNQQDANSIYTVFIAQSMVGQPPCLLFHVKHLVYNKKNANKNIMFCIKVKNIVIILSLIV